MKFEHYKRFVSAGVSHEADSYRERLMLAGMGLSGETGEVCDHAKKVAFHGKDMDRNALLLELGDVLWYFALLADLYDITLDEVMRANVIKLCDRHPHKHGAPEDVIAERAV